MGGSQLPTLVAKEIASLARQPEEAPSLLARAPAPTNRSVQQRANTAQQFDLEKRVLSLIFAKPALALEVDLQFFNQDYEETAAVAEICELVRRTENPEELSDAMLIELTRNSEHSRLIAEAQAVWLSFKLSPDQAEGEFRDAMTKLRTSLPKDEKYLSTKVLKGTATAEERRAYEQRLADKRAH
jgi:hypothetical protein